MQGAVLQHPDGVLCVRFNSSGGFLLSGGMDRQVRIFSCASGQLVASLEGHSWPVRDVADSGDSSRLASCGQDKQVLLWDVVEQRVVRRFKQHLLAVNSVAFSPHPSTGSSVVCSGGQDKQVHCWDVRSRSQKPLQSMPHASDAVTCVRVTQHQVVAASLDGKVRSYDLRAGKMLSDDVGEPITSLDIPPSGDVLLVSSLDDTLRLLDRERGVLLQEFSGHTHRTYKTGCAVSNDCSVVCAGSEDHQVYVWDLLEGNVLAKLQGHTNVVTGVALAPKSRMLASSSTDRSVRIWSY